MESSQKGIFNLVKYTFNIPVSHSLVFKLPTAGENTHLLIITRVYHCVQSLAIVTPQSLHNVAVFFCTGVWPQ